MIGHEYATVSSDDSEIHTNDSTQQVLYYETRKEAGEIYKADAKVK